MSHRIVEPDPRVLTTPKGAASVGQLAELDELSQRLILYTRRWVFNKDEQAKVRRDAVERFGQTRAHLVIAALDIYLQTVAHHAKRPVQRHGLSCNYVGQDEALLAKIVAGAGRQAGPLLRILYDPLISPNGFTETISAALQLHDILCEQPWHSHAGQPSTLH